MLNNKTMRWVVLSISLVGIYGLGYFTYIHIATGQPVAGIIPEIVLYILPVYFVTSLLIEFLLGESSYSHFKRAVMNATLWLVFIILVALLYLIFFQYLISDYALQHTWLGEYGHLIFIFLLTFVGIKFGQYIDKIKKKH